MTEVSGHGTIHLLMTLHQGPAADGVDYTEGHPVVTVELDEQPGLRFVSRLVDTPVEAVTIGMRVRVVFEALSDDLYAPFFTTAGETP